MGGKCTDYLKLQLRSRQLPRLNSFTDLLTPSTAQTTKQRPCAPPLHCLSRISYCGV
jgi:hypothetical protein